MVHDGPLVDPLPVSSLKGISGCSEDEPGTGTASVMKASITTLTDEVRDSREDEASCSILRCWPLPDRESKIYTTNANKKVHFET